MKTTATNYATFLQEKERGFKPAKEEGYKSVINNYHYFDNWHGSKREFTDIKKAIKAAQSENLEEGPITIFNSEGVVKIIEQKF